MDLLESAETWLNESDFVMGRLEKEFGVKDKVYKKYSNYSKWKSDLKKLDSSVKFTGDKDIDGTLGSYSTFRDAEWDGEVGKIWFDVK